MNAEIKKCADANDIKGLRYIFVDCLDVDPTFETYKDDYAYCKTIDGFLVEYEEITPLRSNSYEWNEDYWVKLKVDLLKNFSEKRFMHMIKVARVIKADKIRRLQKERQQVKTSVQEKQQVLITEHKTTQNIPRKASFDANAQQRNFEAAQRKLELENQHTQDEIERKEKKIEEKAKRLKEEKLTKNQQAANTSSSSKKALGIVVLVALVLLLIVLVAVLR